MDFINLNANAKINISLDVLRKRPDGYHDVEMIMQSIDLCDDIYIKKISEGIEVFCDSEGIPQGAGNIAYKAAKLMLEKYGIQTGLKIKIEKKIPVAAGLAGGSSDAAAVLKGINKLFEIGASVEELRTIGKEIGADVPFCISGGTMLSCGIGEILTPIKPFKNVNIVLIKPNISVSTQWVYTSLNFGEIVHRPDTKGLIEALCKEDKCFVARNMGNVLEFVTSKKYGIINELKSKLIDLGALGSMMSGSGPTVFGIFDSDKIAQRAYNQLLDKNYRCFNVKTTGEEIL